jgi:hypothetical protein
VVGELLQYVGPVSNPPFTTVNGPALPLIEQSMQMRNAQMEIVVLKTFILIIPSHEPLLPIQSSPRGWQ